MVQMHNTRISTKNVLTLVNFKSCGKPGTFVRKQICME
jgi:hypothetical protein